MKYIYNYETNKYYECPNGIGWLSDKYKYIEVDKLTYGIGKKFNVSPDRVVELIIKAII